MKDNEIPEICVKKPVDCPKIELHAFRALVRKGGQVSEQGLAKLISHAHLLGFAYYDKILVAVAALKLPRDSYCQKVFQVANSPEFAKNYLFELGWCYTEPGNRGKGLCSILVKALLHTSPSKNIFATTTNDAMKQILKKHGFVESGEPYKSSKRNNRMLHLYILKC